MTRRPVHLFALLTAAALAAGCFAPVVPTSPTELGAEVRGRGALTLTIRLPEPARRVQYVPINTTRSVRVSSIGPRPTDVVTTTADFTANPTVVSLAGVPASTNLALKVEVFDGAGATGKLLQTLWGVVDVQDGASSAASVSWATTPTGLAIDALRRYGDPRMVAATSASALQTLVNNLTTGVHPVLVSGEELANAVIRHTRAQTSRPIASGYAIPAAGDAVLTGVVAAAAAADPVRVYDLLAQEVSANMSVTIGDPVSAVDGASPFQFPTIAPGDWWVFTQSTSGDNRRHAFRKRFAEGDASALPSAYLAGFTHTMLGDGSTALLSDPHQICYGPDGYLYVADTGHHRIVKFAPDGTMTVVAGTGAATLADQSNLGDGGAPTAATLRSPEGVSVDAVGNVFIADTGNHRIRGVEASSGLIKTVCGTGAAGFNGDGTAVEKQVAAPTNLSLGGSPASLYFHDSGNRKIRQIPINAVNITVTSVTSLAIADLTTENTGLAHKTVGGVEYLYYCIFSPAQLIRQTLTGASTGVRLVLAGGGAPAAGFDEGIRGEYAKLGQVHALSVNSEGTVYFGERLGTGYGRVRFTAPGRFNEAFSVLGNGASGVYASGQLGHETPLGAPDGLIAPEPTATSLIVATGGSDHRVVRLMP